MIIGRINHMVHDTFAVLDVGNRFVSGILPDQFNVFLYDPTGKKSNINVDIKDLGDGHYKAGFIPDQLGLWYLTIRHKSHFPLGKAGTFQIYADNFDSIAGMVALIKDIETGRWRIDPVKNEMLFYKDDNETLVARFKLYDEAGNPSSQNVFERKRI